MSSCPWWFRLLPMNLATAFKACAEKHAQKTAIFWGEREISYAEHSRAIAKSRRAFAKSFRREAGRPRRALAEELPGVCPGVFGILQAGAVVVPINNFLKPAEVGYILNDGGIDVLITDADLGALFSELAAARPQLKIFKVECARSRPIDFKPSCCIAKPVSVPSRGPPTNASTPPCSAAPGRCVGHRRHDATRVRCDQG